MPKIDNSIHFKPINIAILTVSDSRSPETDKSGNILAARLISAGHKLADKKIIKDEISSIQDQLKIWINDKNIDAVISTGGTGLTGRDVTPEAFMGIYEKEISFVLFLL